jgi:23S rRNA (cytidine1920-2'-O)/16S rRNA (cytidine1409-2'-O)-methyltransferase
VIDVGAAACGFTRRLLAARAARVVALDVGAISCETSTADPRVLALPRTDVRALSRSARHTEHARADVRDAVAEFCAAGSDHLDPTAEIAALAVVDVSFIPAAEAIEALSTSGLLDTAGAGLLALVKPQFQLDRASVPPSGVVRDPRLQQRALSVVVASAIGWGWTPAGTWRCRGSFVRRGQNTETFALFTRRGTGGEGE